MTVAQATHRIILVMGVSGAGKTTIGTALARVLSAPFIEADDLHPQSNKRMMAAGRPLSDAERWPWLTVVADETLARLRADDATVVVACSALRRRYRDFLRDRMGAIFLVHLHGDRALLRVRMGQRQGHFMPVEMLDSQLATLEPLEADETGIELDIALATEVKLRRALAALDGVRRTSGAIS